MFLGSGSFWEFFFPTKFFFQKCSWGSETHANKNLFFGGGGGFWGVLGAVARGRKTIHFFLWTMICDRLKFWSGPAWRSKSYQSGKPWRRKNKKKKKRKKKRKKKKNSDKTIRHSRRQAGNA